jgi:large subunit ribosomal protein L21
MKKAVITTGGKQYLVTEGQTLDVELLKLDETSAKKTVDLPALMLIDGDKATVGTPNVDKIIVSVEVVNDDVQADKVTSIRYKAKKRVHTVRGHRQHHTTIAVTKIA